MKKPMIKLDALEQLVVLEALKYATESGHFKGLDKTPDGRISLIAWSNIADRTAERVERELYTPSGLNEAGEHKR